jgi:hypothetical protein
MTQLPGETTTEIVEKEAYHLSPELMDIYEAEFITKVEESGLAPEGYAVVVVESGDKYADFGRTTETLAFEGEDYDFHAGMKPYEGHSVFLFTADLHNRAIAHTKRIVGANLSPEGTTGFEVVDDRLKATNPEEVISVADINEFHRIDDLTKCLNVNTNQTTLRCPPGLHSVMSYKGLFEYVQTSNATHLFAYLNRKAAKSLGKLELDCNLLGNREFHLPIPGNSGEYDENYVAYCIPSTANNIDAFTQPDSANAFRRMAATTVPLLWHNRINQLMIDIAPPQSR